MFILSAMTAFSVVLMPVVAALDICLVTQRSRQKRFHGLVGLACYAAIELDPCF